MTAKATSHCVAKARYAVVLVVRYNSGTLYAQVRCTSVDSILLGDGPSETLKTAPSRKAYLMNNSAEWVQAQTIILTLNGHMTPQAICCRKYSEAACLVCPEVSRNFTGVPLIIDTEAGPTKKSICRQDPAPLAVRLQRSNAARKHKQTQGRTSGLVWSQPQSSRVQS